MNLISHLLCKSGETMNNVPRKITNQGGNFSERTIPGAVDRRRRTSRKAQVDSNTEDMRRDMNRHTDMRC